ncbi:MAG: T9SS type A sorting domain-containing protein [Bacteroidetes Order II. Incertae sedis bacterium]|nr:T9SS type A sorting domain-containing protein [Bacteroidetes Order II. bacterium]
MLIAIFLLCSIERSQAQFTEVAEPIWVREGQEANLFYQWQGREPIEGFQLSLPRGLHLIEAFVVAWANPTPQAMHIRYAGKQAFIIPRATLRGGCTLVLRAIAEREGRDVIEIVPIKGYDPNKSASAEVLLHGLSIRREVQIARSFTSSNGKALYLTKHLSKPLEIRRNALPLLHQDDPYSLFCWIKTVGLNVVVLTTWNGKESSAYPLEIRINAMGHLQAFRGQPGYHESLVSRKPVADGQWHHIGVVNNPQARKTYLVVNGVYVDSLVHRVQLNTYSNRQNLMIGMRPDGSRGGSFEGHLQELMFWNRARSAGAIRSTMRQSIQWSNDGLFKITFNESGREPFAYWPPEARLVSSDLLLRYPIQDLSVVQRASSVFLTWRSQQDDSRLFEVERSDDGQYFEKIAAISGDKGVGFEGGKTYSFNDQTAPNEGVLYYRVKQYFTDGAERFSGLVKVGRGVGEALAAELIGNSPNPFNPQTRISYQLRKPQTVELTVWSVAGNLISTLVATEYQEPGIYYVDFNGSDWPSGTYLVRLQTEAAAQVIKIVLAK